jgi:hypothetical protein
VSDDFDAPALEVGAHAAMMAERAPRILAHFDLAHPVLTPAQRTELAGILRSRTIGG